MKRIEKNMVERRFLSKNIYIDLNTEDIEEHDRKEISRDKIQQDKWSEDKIIEKNSTSSVPIHLFFMKTILLIVHHCCNNTTCISTCIVAFGIQFNFNFASLFSTTRKPSIVREKVDPTLSSNLPAWKYFSYCS